MDDGGGKRPGPPQEARNISDYKRVKSHNEEIEKGTNHNFDCLESLGDSWFWRIVL